jgi:hypothetical protein
VGWLDRIRRGPAGVTDRQDEEQGPSPPVGRAAPGVAALFDGLQEDGSHSILDLGPAAESHLRIYSRYARQVRFADLITAPPEGEAWSAAIRDLPPHPHRPYNVVLAWNLLDRIWPEKRRSLIERLAELTAPAARLYAVLDASGAPTSQLHRFTLLDVDRLQEETVGPAERAHSPLLPAQVEKLLEPFEVVRAFTLRTGMREYMAVKRSDEGGS